MEWKNLHLLCSSKNEAIIFQLFSFFIFVLNDERTKKRIMVERSWKKRSKRRKEGSNFSNTAERLRKEKNNKNITISTRRIVIGGSYHYLESHHYSESRFRQRIWIINEYICCWLKSPLFLVGNKISQWQKQLFIRQK
jgi:hypothetical protein